MKNSSQRVFWILALILLPSFIAAQLWYGVAFGNVAVFSIAFKTVCCIALVGLVLQRRILQHNVWAGFFGVAVASTLFGLLTGVGRGLADPSRGEFPGLGALGLVVHALGIFSVFVYVYGSPQIWLASGNSLKPNPQQGGD